ncbi:MAG: RNA polymerase III transcription initiation factor complex subunit [Pycnora praestabilis]|nr:MAG: RNA polymerase III transcription initiation factor complex subunit [Pycnora praestabilis]
MAKSLDDLISFLLEEIALCGEQGASVPDIFRFVNVFYDVPGSESTPLSADLDPEPVNATRPRHGATAEQVGAQDSYDASGGPTRSSPTVDRPFLANIWKWLTNHPDVWVGKEKQWNKLTLDEAEALAAAEISGMRADGDGNSSRGDPDIGSKPDVDKLSNTTPEILPPPDDQSNLDHGKADMQTAPMRVYISQEQMWYAITGHNVDWNKVPRSEFILLSIVAAHKERGILLTDLTRLSHQDKRSTPRRVDALQTKGYLERKPVMRRGGRTSLCTLRKFTTKAALSDAQSSGIVTSEKQAQGDNFTASTNDLTSQIIDIRALLLAFFELLRKYTIMTYDDLKRKLGIWDSVWHSRNFGRTVRRLEAMGCVVRIKARSVYSTPSRSSHRCVKLLREPEDREWQLISDPLSSISAPSRESVNCDVDDDPEADEEDDEPESSLRVDDQIENVEEGNALQEVGRVLPRWTPDRPLANILFDIVDESGTDGVSTMALKAMCTGPFYQRPLEHHITRYTDVWQLSQPVPIRHLSIIRDTAQYKKYAHYKQFSFGNFKQLADSGQASWEVVQLLDKDNKKKAPAKIPAVDAEPELDEHGFPLLPQSLFTGDDSNATLLESVIAVNVDPHFITIYDPVVCKEDNGSYFIEWSLRGGGDKRPIRPLPSDARVKRPYYQKTPDPNQPRRTIGRPRKYPKGEEPYARGSISKQKREKKEADAVKRNEAKARKAAEKKAMAEVAESQKQNAEEAGLDEEAADEGASLRKGAKSVIELADVPYSIRVSGRRKKQPRLTPNNETETAGAEASKAAMAQIEAGIHHSDGTITPVSIPKNNDNRPAVKEATLPKVLHDTDHENGPTLAKRALDHSGTGVFINPPGSEKPRAKRQGRPKKTMIVVFKFSRLLGLDLSKKLSFTPMQEKAPEQPMEEALEQSLTNQDQSTSAFKPIQVVDTSVNISTGITTQFPMPNERIGRHYVLPYAKPNLSTAENTTNIKKASTVQESPTISTKKTRKNREGSHASKPLREGDGVTTSTKTSRDIVVSSLSKKRKRRASLIATAPEPAVEATLPSDPAPEESDRPSSVLEAVIPDTSARRKHEESFPTSESFETGRDVVSPSTVSPEGYGTTSTVDEPVVKRQKVFQFSAPHVVKSPVTNKIMSPSSNSQAITMDLDQPVNKPVSPSFSVPQEIEINPMDPAKGDYTRFPGGCTQIPRSPNVDDTGAPSLTEATINQPDAQKSQAKNEESSRSPPKHNSATPKIQPPLSLETGSGAPQPSKTRWAKRVGMVPGGGSARYHKKRIILDIVRKCGGAYPSDKELWYAFTTAWLQRSRDHTKPDVKTVNEIKKSLIDGMQLRQIVFSFKNKRGMMIKKTIVTTTDIAPNSDVVKELQKKVIAKDPEYYFPSEVEVSAQFKRELDVYRNSGLPILQVKEDATELVELHQKPVYAEIAEQRQRKAERKRKAKEKVLEKEALKQHKAFVLSEASRVQHEALESSFRGFSPPPPPPHPSNPPPPLIEETSPGPKLPRKIRKDKGQTRVSRLHKTKELSDADETIIVGTETTGSHGPVIPKANKVASQRSTGVRKLLTQLKFKNLGPEAFNAELEFPRYTRLTDPVQVFHPTSGTFATNCHPIQNAQRSNFVEVDFQKLYDDFMPNRLEDITEKPIKGRTRNHIKRKDPEWSKFEWDVELVRRWEFENPRITTNKLSKWRFMNHTVPASQISGELNNSVLRFEDKNTISLINPPGLDKFTDSDGEVSGPSQKRQRHNIHPPADGPVARTPEKIRAKYTPLYTFKTRRLTSLLEGSTPEAFANNESDAEEMAGSGNRLGFRRTRRVATDPYPTPAIEQKLMLAVVAVRTLTGGVQGNIDWVIIARLFEPQHSLKYCSKIWPRILQRHRLHVDRLQANFQTAFLKAYEEGAVPPLDFDDTPGYDWDSLINWTQMNVEVPRSDALPELPANRIELDEMFQVRVEANPPSSTWKEIYFYEASSSKTRQESAAAQPFVTALHSTPEDYINKDGKAGLAKSWVRASVIASEEIYDAERSAEKLKILGDEHIRPAIRSLIDAKVIVPQNKGRPVPGRGYDITENFLSSMKTSVDEYCLIRAATYKQYLDAEFAERGSATVSYHAEDGDILALMNLLANNRIRLVPKNPPMDQFGLTDGTYKTRFMDKARLFFNIDIRPSPTYIPHNPLAPPPAPNQHLLDEDNTRIPVWYDIHGHFVPAMWNMAVSATVGTMALRPGATVREVERVVRPSLECWEIGEIMEWLVEAGVAERVGGDGMARKGEEGYVLREWWWLLIGAIEGQGGGR